MLLLDLARLARSRRIQNHREVHVAVVAEEQPLHLAPSLIIKPSLQFAPSP